MSIRFDPHLKQPMPTSTLRYAPLFEQQGNLVVLDEKDTWFATPEEAEACGERLAARVRRHGLRWTCDVQEFSLAWKLRNVPGVVGDLKILLVAGSAFDEIIREEDRQREQFAAAVRRNARKR
jgi:hypothetical protein